MTGYKRAHMAHECRLMSGGGGNTCCWLRLRESAGKASFSFSPLPDCCQLSIPECSDARHVRLLPRHQLDGLDTWRSTGQSQEGVVLWVLKRVAMDALLTSKCTVMTLRTDR